MLKVIQLLDMAEIAGAEMHVLALARSLDKDKFETEIISFKAGPLLNIATENRIASDTILMSERFSLRKFINLINLLHVKRPHIIHLHQPRALLFGAIAARLTRVPLIVATIHSSPEQFTFRASGEIRKIIIKYAHIILERITMRLIDHAIVVSHAISARINRISNGKPITLIYNGVEMEQYDTISRNAAKKKLGIPEDQRVICSIGYIHPLKGYHDVCEAFISIAKDQPDVNWVIVGRETLPGFESSLREQLKAAGLAQRTHFLGVRSDIPVILGAADIFVLASREEPFGRVFAEASAAGLPVLATSVGGIPEIILHERTGLLVPPGSPPMLADGLRRLLGSPEWREELGRAGRAHVQTKFDQKSVTLQTEACYEA